MTSPPEDRANHTSPSGQSTSPGQTPPQVEDEQIKDIVEDNEERLWYITKFGEGKFDGDELENLIEVRSRFRENPSYQLSSTDELEYRKATMAAAAFLEDRHPEAIRLFAQVQRKESPNPLTKWLWMIAIALFLALSSNGYQTLISNQIKRMKQTRSMCIQEATLLTQPDYNLATRLSSMCEQTLVYRAAASQLLVLLPIWTSGSI